jgi:VWFA-related protein
LEPADSRGRTPPSAPGGQTLWLILLHVTLAWTTALPAPCAQAAGGPAGESSPASRPQFKTSADLVQIDVAVADAQGRPVRGLGPGDFVLEEDGVPQKIEGFESVTAKEGGSDGSWIGDHVSTNTGTTTPGRVFVVLFDDLHLSESGAARARAAVAEFLRSLRKGDLVGVASTGGAVWCSGRLPGDGPGLQAAVQRLKSQRPPELRGAEQITDYEAMRIVEYNDTRVLETVVGRWTRGSKIWEQTWGPDGAPVSAGSPLAIGSDRLRAQVGSASSEAQTVQAMANQRHEAAKQRRRQTLQSITRILTVLAGAEGRKSVILMSEGFLRDPKEPQYALASAASRRANAPVYAVDVGGPSDPDLQGDQRRREDTGSTLEERQSLDEGLAAVAQESGGLAITNTGDPAGSLQRIVRESADYYVLGYQPTNGVLSGEFRRVRVSVRREGVRVRARPGYLASPSEPGPGAPGRLEEPARPLREIAVLPFSLPGIPLRMSAYTFEAKRGGTTRTLLVCEMKLDDLSFEQKDGEFGADLDVLLTVTQYATGRTLGDRPVAIRVAARSDLRGQNAWHRITQEVDLPAGLWQARFVVRDRRGGVTGSVAHSVDVPGDGWRLSTPVLSDATASEPDRELQHALPLARRTFAAAGVLYCEFEVYGGRPDRTTGLPRVAAGFEIVREGGAVERQEKPAPVEPVAGRALSPLIMVPLRGLKPANYDLVLKVQDLVTGQTQERREPFTLARPARPTLAYYHDLVQDYAGGRAEDAITTLATWPEVVVADLAKKIDALPDALPRAAVMLHTDAALALRAGGLAGHGRAHLELARVIAARRERETTFRRDWLLAVGFVLQGQSEVAAALPFYLECQQAFPGAAEAWLAAGTVYELSAFPDGLHGSFVARPSGDLVREAEAQYRQALVVDPSLLEARLRLGRVLQRSGRAEEAQAELARVGSASDGGATVALARLFLGELVERRGDADGAARQYRAALELDPSLQPAGLALGGLLGRRGDRQAAVEVLERVLRGGCPLGPPRLLAYRLGFGGRARAAIDALRKAVHS